MLQNMQAAALNSSGVSSTATGKNPPSDNEEVNENKEYDNEVWLLLLKNYCYHLF